MPRHGSSWEIHISIPDRLKNPSRPIAKRLKLIPTMPTSGPIWALCTGAAETRRRPLNSFDKAIEADPKHEVSRMNKGIVLLHDMNDIAGAIKAWEELLAVNPVAMAPTGQSIDQMIQQMKKQLQQQGPAK